MGCASSISYRGCSLGGGGGKSKKKVRSLIPRVAVYMPSLRIPASVDLRLPLRGLVPQDVLDSLCSLRAQILMLAEQNVLSVVRELQRALEDYLPVILGLAIPDHGLDGLVEFKWKNIEGDGKETCFPSAWFEVLCVIHLMAMLCLLEANTTLLPNCSFDSCEADVLEEAKKDAIDLLIRASGYLDCCLHQIMIRLPFQIRESLPCDLLDGVLETISTQALGQAVEMQLGLAIECEAATLSVKRRLACEVVSYYAQAHYCLLGCGTDDSYGKKHLNFIKLKYLEAKAIAYYFHGQLLDKSGPNGHVSAASCFFAANALLMESKKVSFSFCLAVPVTRAPSPWGVMKYTCKKITDAASRKYQMYGYLFEEEKDFQSLPDLPEFPLSLKSNEYELPSIRLSWGGGNRQTVVQSLKEHLRDDEENDIGNITD